MWLLRLLVVVVVLGLVLLWPRSKPEVEVSDDGQAEVLVQNKPHLTEVVRGLFVPWSLVFTGPERMLVSERNGYIRQIVNRSLSDEPVFYFSEVADEGEGGLMGLAIHPDYATNKYVYAMLAYWQNGDIWIKVERLTDEGQSLKRDKIIINRIAGASIHDGGRINFGWDKKLYVTTGDTGKGKLAQDLTTKEGKILRLNDDGTIPEDNPFTGSPVFSYGHRNSQGFDWDPATGKMFATEHGPSGFDGPEGGDEINYIVAGGNYGWPKVSHDRNQPGLIAPLITYTPAIAPSGAKFIAVGRLWVAGLRGTGIYEIIIDTSDPPKILSSQKVAGIEIGRIRDIVVGPDKTIYLLTNNRDGRGQVNPGDDKIFAWQP